MAAVVCHLVDGRTKAWSFTHDECLQLLTAGPSILHLSTHTIDARIADLMALTGHPWQGVKQMLLYNHVALTLSQ